MSKKSYYTGKIENIDGKVTMSDGVLMSEKDYNNFAKDFEAKHSPAIKDFLKSEFTLKKQNFSMKFSQKDPKWVSTNVKKIFERCESSIGESNTDHTTTGENESTLSGSVFEID